jgi:ribosome-associated heat shock protein Hsp15
LAQRLDKWLVYARFAKHRSTAAELIETGKVRLNKERVEKCHRLIKPGDVLTIAIGGHIRVAKVLSEAERRGSATVASQLYQDLTCAEKADARPEALC